MGQAHGLTAPSQGRAASSGSLYNPSPTSVAQILQQRKPEDQRPVVLMAQDEARFGRICEPRGCWTPPGIRPPPPTQAIRQAVYAFAARAPNLGKLVALVLPSADTDRMNLFLQRVSQEFSDSLLIRHVAQAGWHRSREVRCGYLKTCAGSFTPRTVLNSSLSNICGMTCEKNMSSIASSPP